MLGPSILPPETGESDTESQIYSGACGTRGTCSFFSHQGAREEFAAAFSSADLMLQVHSGLKIFLFV